MCGCRRSVGVDRARPGSDATVVIQLEVKRGQLEVVEQQIVVGDPDKALDAYHRFVETMLKLRGDDR